MRQSVLADEIKNPDAAAAMRIHRNERDSLLDAVAAALRENERVRAAWLWGSFLKDEQDDLSDLDIWLLVEDGDCPTFGESLKEICRQLGTVVTMGENPRNGPQGGGYLGVLMAGTHGLHHLDIYWQDRSKGELPDRCVLLNRLDEPGSEVDREQERPKEPEETPLEKRAGALAFIWLMLSVVAKHLARNRASDMELLTYPRPSFEETVAFLGLESEIGEVDWTPTGEPAAKLNVLRRIAEKTALLEETCRRKGLDVPKEANPCLMRYFEMVEGALPG